MCALSLPRQPSSSPHNTRTRHAPATPPRPPTSLVCAQRRQPHCVMGGVLGGAWPQRSLSAASWAGLGLRRRAEGRPALTSPSLAVRASLGVESGRRGGGIKEGYKRLVAACAGGIVIVIGQSGSVQAGSLSWGVGVEPHLRRGPPWSAVGRARLAGQRRRPGAASGSTRGLAVNFNSKTS